MLTADDNKVVSSFAARVDRLIDRLEFRKVENGADLREIQLMRYKAYLKEGAISVSSDETLTDRYDDDDHAANIGVYLQGKLVSAIRLHMLSRPGQSSPGITTFPDILNPYLEQGKKIVDPSRFVVDYASGRAYPELPYATLRTVVMASAFHDADFFTAAVRVEHQAFYKRFFFARTVCMPRVYPGLIKPLCLMLVDFGADQARIIDRNSFYASSQAERHRLFGGSSPREIGSALPVSLAYRLQNIGSLAPQATPALCTGMA